MINKLVFVSFLNDYSGSPNVLSVVIKGLIDKGYKAEIITNRSEGFLSNISNIYYNYVTYHWSDNRMLALFYFLIAQLQLFFKVYSYKEKDVLFYINTITPIGAVWACKIFKKNYVYHVHENMAQRKSLYLLYRWTYRFCNIKTIFVSHYLKNTALNVKNSRVVYNSLDKDFLQEAEIFEKSSCAMKNNILMISSLKIYKGVYEFVEIAKKMPKYNFILVLNTSEEQTEKFKLEAKIPNNIAVYPAQENVHPFYRKSRLLLQLSHPTLCVESFGLTILEAMSYGIPAIVPNIGGPIELVEDGVSGYTIDPLDQDSLILKIGILMENKMTYENFSRESLIKSKRFRSDKMINEIEKYLFE